MTSLCCSMPLAVSLTTPVYRGAQHPCLGRKIAYSSQVRGCRFFSRTNLKCLPSQSSSHGSVDESGGFLGNIGSLGLRTRATPPKTEPASRNLSTKASVDAAQGLEVVEKPAVKIVQQSTGYGAGLGWLYDTPQRGTSSPLGASLTADNALNFAITSTRATAVSLVLFTEKDLAEGRITSEIPLDPVRNRTGNTWHVCLRVKNHDILYGYRVWGPEEPTPADFFDPSKVLLDPYAKGVLSRPEFGVGGWQGDCWPQAAGVVPRPGDVFDWQGDSPPQHHMADLVVYEMHVRGFTQHASSRVAHPGTFAGVVERLPYLKDLGVNAIELLPVMEFNEMEYYGEIGNTGTYRFNFWGYSTLNFFSPMQRYGRPDPQFRDCGRGVQRELKTLVREAHKNGIEVILDVVFNHTAEGNEFGPNVSFRGIDNGAFYMLAPGGQYYNYSGCGNTFDCNHPTCRRFILDCLRHWVTEYRIDGFRFDLAAILTRSSSNWERGNIYGSHGGESHDDGGEALAMGTPLKDPPLVAMLSKDGILRSTKLIAEAWDAGGLYLVGNFPNYQNRWQEWNGRYRDDVRNFIKGTDGTIGNMANRICASPDIYQHDGRNPYDSINFVTCHDGFTLMDAVSYNEKRNMANGENNNDGENHNLTWNCGEEGGFVTAATHRLRMRQVRNFMVSLLVSQGVPMILMGDEYLHTKLGNNNTYCHDSELNWFRWDKLETPDAQNFFRFTKSMIRFRKDNPVLRMRSFLQGDRLFWHGQVAGEAPDWSDAGRVLAFELRAWEMGGEDLYIAFNASHLSQVLTIPDPRGRRWVPVVDTGKTAPYDFITDDLPEQERRIAYAQYQGMLEARQYPMLPYSSIILKAVAV
eukprot:jgi/Mesvir1/17312/Mv07708-RA.1